MKISVYYFIRLQHVLDLFEFEQLYLILMIYFNRHNVHNPCGGGKPARSYDCLCPNAEFPPLFARFAHDFLLDKFLITTWPKITYTLTVNTFNDFLPPLQSHAPLVKFNPGSATDVVIVFARAYSKVSLSSF